MHPNIFVCVGNANFNLHSWYSQTLQISIVNFIHDVSKCLYLKLVKACFSWPWHTQALPQTSGEPHLVHQLFEAFWLKRTCVPEASHDAVLHHRAPAEWIKYLQSIIKLSMVSKYILKPKVQLQQKQDSNRI